MYLVATYFAKSASTNQLLPHLWTHMVWNKVFMAHWHHRREFPHFRNDIRLLWNNLTCSLELERIFTGWSCEVVVKRIMIASRAV
jgi:hypothetical protein